MDEQTTHPQADMQERPPIPRMGIFFSLIVLTAAGFVAVWLVLGNPGPGNSNNFMPVTTDISAIEFEGDRPVLAVVTASWCEPCQHLKRTTLSDERVRDLIRERTQPVMIDGTDSNEAASTLQQLGVRAFPTTVILRDGRPVAMLEGYAPADKYLSWLDSQL